MSNRAKILFVLALVFTMLFSIVGAGIVGGAAGYYISQRNIVANSNTTNTLQVHQASSISNSNSTVAAVQATSPAVVTVINTLETSSVSNPFQQFGFPFGGRQIPQAERKSSGSGVIISEDGYIVTNNHVVENSASLEVIYADGSRHSAKLIGTDAFSDLAVIQVKDPVPAVAQLGDSDALQPGETVIAIGSPLGDFKNSVTQGIVSALNRNVGGQEGLIQTDAAINHGNSGGPLINLQGQVVGINTLVVRGNSNSPDQAEGLGFAIPSSTVKSVCEQLIAKGKVERPYLGIQYTLLDLDIASQLGIDRSEGALIQAVEQGGPSAKAGLKPGDIITAINDQSIDNDNSLSSVIMRFKVGEKVEVTAERDGKTLSFAVTLGERPNN
jgi:Trypsin-like serine proteases, typically periplasmic, contain C-terminal PDZ domain